MNYLGYTVNKTHVTIAYLQSVNFHHTEVKYKLLASKRPTTFQPTLLFSHFRITKPISLHFTNIVIKTAIIFGIERIHNLL